MINQRERESWEQKIRQRYPSLLSKLSCFETNPGWNNLLEDMLEEISCREKILIETNKFQNEYDKIYIVQVKQKFGELRVYYDGLNDTVVNSIIEKTELIADTVCENCCSTKEVTKRYIRGWVCTLCSNCKDESLNTL